MLVRRIGPMRALLVVLSFTLLPSASALAPVNAVTGDQSWVDRYGVLPSRDAPEALRIATHLAWVERQLRAAPVAHLSSSRRQARAHLLDVLHAYVLIGRFPRHSAPQPFRRPRFVDDAGTHCAVAELVRATAGPALVERIRAAHAYDLIRDMHEPSLSAWADENGMSLDELARIQPTYDDGSGGAELPIEEPGRRPRTPLTSQQIEYLLPRANDTGLALACLPDRDGHWTAEIRVRVEPGIVVHADATVVIAGTTTRDHPLERCVRHHVETLIRAVVPRRLHTLARAIEVTRTTPIDAWSEAELDEALVAEPLVRLRETRAQRLAACVTTLPGSDPLRLPLRVELNASIVVRWDELPPAATDEERTRQFCIERALAGPIARVRRPRRLVTVDLMRDGELQVVREPLRDAR